MIAQLESLDIVFVIVFGIIFLVGGILKFYKFQGFKTILVSYRIIPRKVIDVAAYFIATSEIVVGLLLIISVAPRLMMTIALIMMTAYTGGIVYAMASGTRMNNCGCFGASVPVKIGWKKLTFNVFIISTMVVLLIP